jgi:hypothetical protein
MVTSQKIFGAVWHDKERCFTHEEPQIEAGSPVWCSSSSPVVDGMQSLFEEVLICFIHSQSMSLVREKRCLMTPQDFCAFSNLFSILAESERQRCKQTGQPIGFQSTVSVRPFSGVLFCCITLNILFDSKNERTGRFQSIRWNPWNVLAMTFHHSTMHVVSCQSLSSPVVLSS